MLVAPSWLREIMCLVQGLVTSAGCSHQANQFPSGPALAGAGHVDAPIAVDVTHAEVVTESGGVAVGQDEALPPRGIARVFGDAKPGDRIREVAVVPAAGGQQLGPSVAVEIGERDSVHAVDAAFREIVDQVKGQGSVSGFLGCSSQKIRPGRYWAPM